MDKDFNEESFWKKIKKYAEKIGKPVIEAALTLFFCFQDKDTPLRIKTIIASALAYFVFPIDLIPDIIPVVGYSDDLGALVMALVAATFYIKPEHRQAAEEKLSQWFKNEQPESLKKQEISQYLQIAIIAILKREHNIYVENEEQNIILSFARKKIKISLQESSDARLFLDNPKTLKSCYENAIKALHKEVKDCPPLSSECLWTIEEILNDDF